MQREDQIDSRQEEDPRDENEHDERPIHSTPSFLSAQIAQAGP